MIFIALVLQIQLKQSKVMLVLFFAVSVSSVRSCSIVVVCSSEK